jgi:hypothetical protein
VALAAGEAGAAEGHALVDRHVVAHLGRFADHHARAVVDEQPAADLGGRVDLDPGEHLRDVGQHARCERHAGLVEGVRDAVREQRLHAPHREQDLRAADAARGRVALLGGREVLAHLARHASECG